MKIEDEAAAVLNFIVKAKFNYGLSREGVGLILVKEVLLRNI